MTDKTLEDEARTRAINAEPWEPLAGMVKKQCSQCRYIFALLVAKAEATSRAWAPDQCGGASHRPAKLSLPAARSRTGQLDSPRCR